MKKILLLFILCFTTLFGLVSCKKNEPVGRVMANFLTDFSLESVDDFAEYDAIVGNMKYENRVVNFKNSNRKLEIDFTPNKKVAIKSVSFRLYNYSETETLKILVNEKDNYGTFSDDTCIINNLTNDYAVVDILPNSYQDITVNTNNLVLKKNTTIKVLFGFTIDSTVYGIDYATASAEDKKTAVNRLNNCAGICNFKIEYNAYMKV